MSLIAKWFGIDTGKTGLSRNDMVKLARGECDLKQLANFTETPLHTIKHSLLKLDSPSPCTSNTDSYTSFHSWRFCPVCVKEKKPHHRAWLLPYVTACPEHSCQLVDKCFSCGHKYSTILLLNRFCNICQKAALVIPCSQEEFDCSSLLITLLDQREKLKAVLDRLTSTWFVTSHDCLRPHFKLSPQLRSVSEMREVISHVWSASVNEETHREALISYRTLLNNRWEYLPHLSSLVFKDIEVLESETVKPNATWLRHIDLSAWWLPVSVASRSLGISEFILKKLADGKFFKTKDFKQDGKHKFRMVNVDSLNDFVRQLLSFAMPAKDTRQLTNINHFPMDEIITDVLENGLPLYFGKNRDLSDLWVINANTSKSLRRNTKPSDAVTTNDACKLLTTYHSVIVYLIKHEFLIKHKASQKQRFYITLKSLEMFNEKYIVISKIAQEHDLNPTNLAEKLAAVGIKSISSDSLVKVYLRTDLEGIDISKLKDVTVYDTATGRKPSFDEMSVSSIPVKNLIKLVNHHGGITKFIRRFGGSPGTLSLMLREKKKFGDLAIRRMAKKVGIDKNWFYQ